MSRRTSTATNPLTRILMGTGILVGGGLLTYAGLSYFGLINTQKTGPAKSDHKGLVRVYKSQRDLTALSKVTREDVVNRSRGDEAYFWMTPAKVKANPDWILNHNQIIGRVLAKNKEGDLIFTEKDFLPEGSRTGISAGVPEGKQGFFVEAEKIPGLELLKMGDKFDLLASLPEEAQEKPEAEYGLLAGGIKVRGGKPIPLSGVRLLVQDAQMVAITRGRDMTTQSVMNLPKQDPKTRRKDDAIQITIAIDPEEVVPLTQALAAERAIHCVARSGRKLDAMSNHEQELEGLVPYPATARSMKAYTKITADDLADPDTGELRVYYFKPELVGKGWIGSVNDLIGRVVARDTTAGFIFSPDDLLPANATVNEIKAYSRIQPEDLADPRASAELIGRVAANDLARGAVLTETNLLPPDVAPGIAGGTPMNRMAISVDTKTLRGIRSLGRGDRFDLMASVPFKPGEAFAVLGSKVEVSSGTISQSELQDRARNTVLAEAAIVVDPGEETATIAVRPQEVAAITKAITLGTSIYALTRSGRSDPGTPVKPGPSRLQSDPGSDRSVDGRRRNGRGRAKSSRLRRRKTKRRSWFLNHKFAGAGFDRQKIIELHWSAEPTLSRSDPSPRHRF